MYISRIAKQSLLFVFIFSFLLLTPNSVNAQTLFDRLSQYWSMGGGNGSGSANEEVIFSGDFHRDFWLPNLSLVQQDAQVNGGVTVVRNSGAYANQATADRLCSLLDPKARAGQWRGDRYTSPGNNHIVLWNGSSWERHGARNYNNHLRYQFTCIKDAAAAGADLTADTPELNSGTFISDKTVTFKSSITNNGIADAKGTFDVRFQLDVGNDGVYDFNLDAMDEITDLGAASTQTNVTTVLSGDFHNTYWLPNWTKVQQDAQANGGISVTREAGAYANQATADRLCSLIDPAARASVWKSDSYSSPGNNYIILWNGSSWERHGASGYNRHLRYQFTCTKTTSSQTEAQSKDAISPTWTAEPGVYAVRACADLPGSDIGESNENNNCGPDMVFTVTDGGLSVTLSAYPSLIASGELSQLSWVSSGATSCSSDDFTTSGQTQGADIVTPPITTTYTITCTDAVESQQGGSSSSNTGGTSNPGVWEYQGTDYTDYWCPRDYGYLPPCPSNPEGKSCSVPGLCGVDSGVCIVRTDIYSCQATSSSGSGTGEETPPATTAANTVFDSVTVTVGAEGIDLLAGIPTVHSGALFKDVPITFRSQITNIGGDDALGAFDVRFQIDENNDGGTDYDINLDSLGAINGLSGGESKNAISNTWVASVGQHAVRVCADVPGNDIDEANEGNNCGPELLITVKEFPQCSDGTDNDGDGFIDYPNDPGCYGPLDDDERDVQCSDGIDNDGDGNTDYPNDAGCSSLNDDDEATIPPASVSLAADPMLVRKGERTSLSWSAQNVQSNSCSITGTNGDSSAVGRSGSLESSPLENSTTFTFTCRDLSGEPISASVSVTVIPSFKEI